jgi:calcium/calmodulin-dependent protein kinase (CaM kinase) II
MVKRSRRGVAGVSFRILSKTKTSKHKAQRNSKDKVQIANSMQVWSIAALTLNWHSLCFVFWVFLSLGDPMADTVTQELLKLNQQLLDAIARADWAVYRELCDPSLTCFEPESLGQLVQGLDFHEFYFKLGPVQGHHCTTMASPHVRDMGDVAVISYVRINQRVSGDGATTRAVEETRVWQRQEVGWKHVHFHRSAPGK